ncbi:hypothetical protein CAI21_14205 [Alkalilimnicola ehrlichii]|uniref:Ketoreductase domain-containing protein n=1 Tax=Alkalilimnicola ehrlichii TaxID=351052 RepID=A0A3E0WMF0_9GAMM|nr:SDR family oxidoreductase [Alkalilimnicola ehrlichii]RFA27766.1 hypothetical protein CAI21_14205 [Alkalilimnicola ehrlichii]RFA33589.1 hypothetical protein CAL65_17215 [Alkalilimnicola ehrlichii]
MTRLTGQVALITGGSKGIGQALAQRLAEQGVRVYLAARDREQLAAAAAAMPGEVSALPADLSRTEGAKALLAELAQREERLDLLVNCAGQFDIGPVEALGPDAAERLIQINYLGTVRVIDAALPMLRQSVRRSIVNVSSLAGCMAPPYMTAYAASKFAVTGYTRALRQELRAEGFHVGLISPGPVDTTLIEGHLGNEYYPLPPGVPVVRVEVVADAIIRAVTRRKAEVVLPARLGPASRLMSAFPGIVDLMYRWLAGRAGSKPEPVASNTDK